MSSLPRYCVLILSAAMAGCASARSAAPYDVDALGQSLLHTICANAPPTIETVPNRSVDGVLDSIEHRTCAQGSSTMYVSAQASDPSGLAMNLVIREPGSGVPDFMDIGKPVSSVIRKLGQPTYQSGNSATYVFGDYEDSFTIEASDGVVRSLTWLWTVD